MHRIDDFVHEPGTHCGSTAMADMLRHVGLELSEPMVFGLGSGAGFYYLKGDSVSPSRQIVGRHPRLETHAAEALGLEMEAHRTRDAEEGWRGVREAIDAGRPALVQCDLAELPYWETDTPFNGHRIVVVGYDETTGEVEVADTHFEGFQRIDRGALRRARASEAPPSFGNQFAWWEIVGGEPRELEDAIEEALERNAEAMTDDESGIGGLAALKEFKEEVRDWEALEDGDWCYRFAYQCIEQRGTGGGMFRYMYRNFLGEASEHLPMIDDLQLGISMNRNADAWSTLARYLEAAADVLDPDCDAPDTPDKPPSHHVESLAEAVYQFETTFWNQLSSAF
jgi:hypothetical protein